VSGWAWILVGLAACLVVYAVFVAWLVAAGRRSDARAAVRFVPDAIVLFRRLLGDARIPRRRKLVLLAVVAYLATPIDVVPDFVPVAGYLDDVVIVAFALRHVLRGAPRGLVEEHWPGPPESLALLVRLAGLSAPGPRCRPRRGP
jgi:uncharacterized membrane protein YkvA (DUF1232 family)